MPLMSFAKTLRQLRDGSQDVTRRDGWPKLKAGDVLTPVEWLPQVGSRWFCDTCGEAGPTARGDESGWCDRHRVRLGCVKRYGPPLRLADIRVVSVQHWRLGNITPKEVAREGFPGMSPAEFVAHYCAPKRPDLDRQVRRIEFERIEE